MAKEIQGFKINFGDLRPGDLFSKSTHINVEKDFYLNVKINTDIDPRPTFNAIALEDGRVRGFWVDEIVYRYDLKDLVR